jgi:hypothetical protein
MYFLHGCTRHTRTLPLLTDLEASRQTDLRGLGFFPKAVIGTQECAVGERVHVDEVDARTSLGKRVPLGPLQEIL